MFTVDVKQQCNNNKSSAAVVIGALRVKIFAAYLVLPNVKENLNIYSYMYIFCYKMIFGKQFNKSIYVRSNLNENML